MASTGNKEKRNKVVRKGKIRQSGDFMCTVSTTALQQKMHETSNSVSCDRPFSSVPLLDMLAEVASATLKNDPSLNDSKKELKRNSPQKTLIKVPSRKSYYYEHLSLDQIRVLSDKMLLEMFSELVSDEIRKNYSYQCFLMPEKCSQRFSSFGSETKARHQMKSHLLTHIAELLAEANAPGKSHRIKFIAEPLHVRKKRLLEGSSKKKRQVRQSERNMKRKISVLHKEKDSIQVNDVQKLCSSENGKTKYNHPVISPKKDYSSSKWKKRNRIQFEHKEYNRSSNIEMISGLTNTKTLRQKKVDIKSPYTKIKRKNCSDKVSNNNKSYKINSQLNKRSNCFTDCAASCATDSFIDVEIANKAGTNQFNHIDKCHNSSIELIGQKFNRSFSSRSITAGSLHCNETVDNSDDNHKTKNTQEKSTNHFKENAKTYQVDTLEQPQHDHCYTTVLGKRRGIGTFHFEYSSSSDEDSVDKDSVTTEKNSESSSHPTISTPCFPFVFTPLLPNISQILEVGSLNSEGNTVKQTGKVASSQTSSGNTVAPSIITHKPKQTRVRRVNRIIIAEELKSDSEEDSENIPSLTSGKMSMASLGSSTNSENSDTLTESTKRRSVEGTPEWEKKLALKCIRALRYKKKEERGPLQCRICKDKKFTAQATLMYHYRSHAGIKPFTCVVCGATFTRQHSLNYHMLIHNNKSRFVCNDCGRNFRHPSHYKEHLRRHTGETPYECSDCTLRFKTRNTFKRHLKTRHGKILTAQGIATLTVEEFFKVRTIPRKKLQKSLPIKKKDQETQWPEVNAVKIDDECIMEESQ